jgi:hypothetical protein
MNSWAYLQAFNADHDDIHFFTLTLGNFFGKLLYVPTNLHKRVCIFINLHKYPYSHNFIGFSHNFTHTTYYFYWFELFDT